jgi:lipase chaperone LimK
MKPIFISVTICMAVVFLSIIYNTETTKPNPTNLQLTKELPQVKTNLSIKSNNDVNLENISKSSWFNNETRYVFERFFEVGDGNIDKIKHAFNGYCKPLAHCNDLSRLFNRYLQFKQDFVDLKMDKDRDNIELIYEVREDIKDKYFSELEQSMLFSLESSWDIQMIARRKILSNTNLSETQKRDAMEIHLENLPEEQKLDFKNTIYLEKVMDFNYQEKLVDNNFNELADEFSIEIAQRLIEDYKEQDNWNKRIDAYKKHKNNLENVHRDDEELINSLLDTFLQEKFDDKEIKRVHVLTKKNS